MVGLCFVKLIKLIHHTCLVSEAMSSPADLGIKLRGFKHRSIKYKLVLYVCEVCGKILLLILIFKGIKNTYIGLGNKLLMLSIINDSPTIMSL